MPATPRFRSSATTARMSVAPAPRLRILPVDTRLTRNGYEVTDGPLRQPLSVASLIARDIGLLLFVAGCVTVGVWMVAP
jgi:hypothetical protein